MEDSALNKTRPETESYTSYLGSILTKVSSHHSGSKLRILDLCTGTGCIPLLLHSLLCPAYPDLRLLGVDISSKAVQLAKKNLEWNIQLGNLASPAQSQVTFQHGDVLDPKYQMIEDYDIVISNPPYISPRDFAKDTQRSVRNFEPRLALVPPQESHKDPSTLSVDDDEGDVFYPRILQIAQASRAKMVLMEVDGMKQAKRVAAMTRKVGRWGGVQIWCDGLEETRWSGQDGQEEVVNGSDGSVPVLGHGRERAVFATTYLDIQG